ncbi:MAG TPA: tetratricopeptide repeat protein, partial [Candidatus Sulfotelmatobacter sp.]|nr:tetratricopeptide repeat protein [Candidatus Sulfotelmatobacter sp.]
EQQEQWPKAIELYDGWLATFTNHPARPSAEYFRGWANFQARRDTNALSCFTNFLVRFPTNEFSPLAQWWVADYYFRQGSPADLKTAEMNYQLLALNWPGSQLAYQARMMAGRVAVKRQGWSDAKDYFTKLWNDTNGPPELRAQALFALGDTLMSIVDSSDTNKLANYDQAINAFEQICRSYPSNRLAVLAWGEKALCHLQAAQYSEYDRASNAFRQVIEAPLTNGMARSIATIGLGLVLEKQAQQKTGAEQTTLLKLALNHYLDVFDGKVLHEGEQPDLFWTQKAGLEAGRLAEALQEWSPALHVYERLQELLPPLRPKLEKSILKAQEQLARQKT